jgi:phosphate transport system ATP-binding protein
MSPAPELAMRDNLEPSEAPEAEVERPVARGGASPSPVLPTRPSVAPPRPGTPSSTVAGEQPKLTVEHLNAWYRSNHALHDVSLVVPPRSVTAAIGPSGCGKSTFLRCLNRMHELVPGARAEGRLLLDGQDLLGREVDPVVLRRRVGMVFQRPNPFPTMSVRDNVAAGLKLNGAKGSHDEIVERTLRQAALWDEVKDRLDASALSLSGGQQQRLCIARALAVEPEVLLMDEPASALDPIATAKIEDLIHELKVKYTIVIVTHNMQQAARVSDQTAFFYMGDLVEVGPTERIFTNPDQQRTEDYVTGKFG